MNLAAFRVRYPEFGTAVPDPFVQAFLDEAARDISSDLAGTLYDDAHGALTAHLLAMSPHGKNARLVAPANGQTTYLLRFNELKLTITAGAGRVA